MTWLAVLFLGRPVADADSSLLAEFCARVNRPVMARGGLAHLATCTLCSSSSPQGLDGIIIDDARYDAAFAYSEALAASADRFDLFFWGLPP